MRLLNLVIKLTNWHGGKKHCQELEVYANKGINKREVRNHLVQRHPAAYSIDTAHWIDIFFKIPSRQCCCCFKWTKISNEEISQNVLALWLLLKNWETCPNKTYKWGVQQLPHRIGQMLLGSPQTQAGQLHSLSHLPVSSRCLGSPSPSNSFIL